MYLKSEFKKRISRLRNVIDAILVDDGNLNEGLRGFFPALYSVFSLVWSQGCDVGFFLKSTKLKSTKFISSPYPENVLFPFLDDCDFEKEIEDGQ